MKIEKYINFNLTGNITLQIFITWIIVSILHSAIVTSLLSHFDDHIYKFHWTYFQFLTHGQFIAFNRCVFTMTALYLITPSSFVMRVSIIYFFGIIGALSGDMLGFMVKGM